MNQDPEATRVTGPSGSGDTSDSAGTGGARRIGPWRTLGILGEGGMGVVYLAERSDGAFDRQVALKLLRPGLDAGSFEARFLQERRTLGALDHPYIARLLDAGRSDDGLPYFAMERVEGQPIDAWCQSHGLDLDARIALFQQVCEAVQYAHGRLIVHRDIKPSNVLVDTEGRVRLLDFGIAKLLDETGEAALTRASERLLTPQYAAPEQLLGQPVGVGADVYALGMLLYLLLADELPYRLAGTTAMEQHQLVCEREPPPPSAQSADSARVAQLRGDLDLIVLAALRKEPARRYASVEALAADLRRWQQGLPITARPDTLGYRARRFVRRNRLAVAAGVLVFLSLAGGLATSLWQAREAEAARALAEQRYRDVRELANGLLNDVDEALVEVPGATRARRILVERAVAYLDRLSQEGARDPELLLELADGYGRVADILGNPYEPNLGDLDGAREHSERALALREEAARLDPRSRPLAEALARGELQLASLGYAADSDVVRLGERVDGVVDRLRSVQAEGHTSEALERTLTFALNLSGDTRNARQDFAGAADRHEQALVFIEGARAESNRPDFWRRLDAISRMKLAHARWWLDADPEQVIAEFLTALEQLEALHRDDPGNARLMRLLAHAHANVVNVVAFERDLGQALPYASRTLELGERLLALDPANRQHQRDMAGWHRMSRNLYETGMYWPEADREAEAAIAIYEALLKVSPGDAAIREDLNFTQCERAIGLLRGTDAGVSEGSYAPARRCLLLAPCMDVLEEVESKLPPQPREADRYDRLRALYARCGAQPDDGRRLR